MRRKANVGLLGRLRTFILGGRGPYTLYLRGNMIGTIYLADRFAVDFLDRNSTGQPVRLEEGYHSCVNPSKPANGNILDLSEVWEGVGNPPPLSWGAFDKPWLFGRKKFRSPPKKKRLLFRLLREKLEPADWEAVDGG